MDEGQIIKTFETYLDQAAYLEEHLKKQIYTWHPRPETIEAALEVLRTREPLPALEVSDGKQCPRCHAYLCERSGDFDLMLWDNPRYCPECGGGLSWETSSTAAAVPLPLSGEGRVGA